MGLEVSGSGIALGQVAVVKQQGLQHGVVFRHLPSRKWRNYQGWFVSSVSFVAAADGYKVSEQAGVAQQAQVLKHPSSGTFRRFLFGILGSNWNIQ